MFTGWIQTVGKIVRSERRDQSMALVVESDLDLSQTRLGDSIAVDGACLTVTELGERTFTADASYETMDRTTLRDASPGTPVNLEHAMAANDRFHGHMVLGHVDGIGEIAYMKRKGPTIELEIAIPQDLHRYCADKGSIALDGISLTINKVTDKGVRLAVVPHTQKNTSLNVKAQGGKVNIECDILAKYLARLVSKSDDCEAQKDDKLKKTLEESGFLS